jgi:hypothetical protein
MDLTPHAGHESRKAEFRGAVANLKALSERDPLTALERISVFIERQYDEDQSKNRMMGEELDFSDPLMDAEAAADELRHQLEEQLGVTAFGAGSLGVLSVRARVMQRRFRRPRPSGAAAVLTVRLHEPVATLKADTELQLRWGLRTKPTRDAWRRLRPGANVEIGIRCPNAAQFRAGTGFSVWQLAVTER